MRDASSKGWTNLQSASMKGWANIQSLVNQAGGHDAKSLTSGTFSGGGYGAVNGMSTVNNGLECSADPNWDWDSYSDINSDEASDIVQKKVETVVGDEEHDESWAWGSGSESPVQKSQPRNEALKKSSLQSSKTRNVKGISKAKMEAGGSSDGWDDLITWDNDEWSESSSWSNEEWQSPKLTTVSAVGTRGNGKKAD